MESEKLKEGDEVVLRGKIQYRNSSIPNACIVKGKHFSYSVLERDLVKVRPGTYEVTAREVTKMICRSCWTFWKGYMRSKKPTNGCKLEQPHFKKLQRWVHCRLRELKWKRK